MMGGVLRGVLLWRRSERFIGLMLEWTVMLLIVGSIYFIDCWAIYYVYLTCKVLSYRSLISRFL